VALALTLPVAGRAYEVADGGALIGTVRFVGTPPKLDPIPVNKNRDVCGEAKPSEVLVLGPGHGVRGSVVMIEGVTRGEKAGNDVLLDNHKCQFVAHVTAVRPGDRVRVRNSDPVLHNTHGFLNRTTVFNLALPNEGQAVDITRRLAKPGVVHVLCDAHTHMSAWVVVHDNPYVAVTDAHGAFRIADVPPGTYRVTMWHAGFHPSGADKDGRPVYDEPRTITKEVTIAPRAVTTVEFELR
jgi:plastocyanin